MSGGAAAAGGGLGLVGGIFSANAANEKAMSESDVARRTEQLNNYNATNTVLQTAEEVRTQKVIGRKAIGGIRAAIGASGIQTEGSVLDVLEESAANSKLDELRIKHAGDLKAYAYKMGAENAGSSADAARAGGQYGQASGILSGVSSFAKGVI